VEESSSDGVAIRYVLPVFMPWGQWARIKHDVSKLRASVWELLWKFRA